MLLMMMIRKIIIIFCLLCMYVCSLLYSNLPISREKSVCVPFCFGECEHYDMTVVLPLLLDYMTKMLKLQYMYFSLSSQEGTLGKVNMWKWKFHALYKCMYFARWALLSFLRIWKRREMMVTQAIKSVTRILHDSISPAQQ